MTIMKNVLAGAIAAALFGTVASAQVRQVPQNGLMDANPQVGSGGSNRPVPGFVPVNGNDIMTGNVTGLGYFHAPVGTVNQYQFQGRLGSASLSSFVRQSGGNPANGGTYLGYAQPFYLPSATVSTGAAGYNPIPIGGGGNSALVPRTAYSPLISGAEIRTLTGASSGAGGTNSYGLIDRVAEAPVVPGSPGALTSSSLFVLRTTELPTTRPDVGMPTTAPASMPFAAPENGTGEGGVNATPPSPEMIQGAIQGDVEARVTGKYGDLKSPMVSDNYLKLAEEIKKVEGFPAPLTASTQPGTTTAPAGLALTIDPLTGLPRKMATQPPLNGRGGLTLEPGTGAAAQGAATQAAVSASAKRLVELSDRELQAGGKVKPVRIAPAPPMLAPGTTGPMVMSYDLQMQRGEKNLAEGRYMDAAEAYQNALSLKPSDPLALIGRAHAELAGGIYAGAEFDLKFVFTRKPELVGLKYEANSFVPTSRQEYLLDDLQKATGKKEMANMASFLYCYVCYETGRTELLKTELEKWGARAGHDDWAEVAARAWGGK
jgi:hypothetical protein